MIYTLTLSPAIDLYMEKDQIELGKLNRMDKEYMKIGGKGINVSLGLKALGVCSIPIVVLGGFTGKYIEEVLEKEFSPIVIASLQPTRINVKLKGVEETELNGNVIIEETVQQEIKKILADLKEQDILMVCGNVNPIIYKSILSGLSCKLILDVDGKALKELIFLKPWIVKPNEEELKEIRKCDQEAYAYLLRDAEIILHTKGSLGATLVTKDERIYAEGISSSIVSTVGSGDAFLAGFITLILQGKSLKECLDFANVCGNYHAKTGKFFIEKH